MDIFKKVFGSRLFVKNKKKIEFWEYDYKKKRDKEN